LSHGVMTII